MSRGGQGGGAAGGPGRGAREGRGAAGRRGGGARGAGGRRRLSLLARGPVTVWAGVSDCALVLAQGPPWLPPGLREPADPQQTHVRAPPGSPAFSPARSVRCGTPGGLRGPASPRPDLQTGKLRPAAGVGAQAPKQTHVRSAPGSPRLAGPGRAALRHRAIVSSRGGGSGARGAPGRRRTTETWKRYLLAVAPNCQAAEGGNETRKQLQKAYPRPRGCPRPWCAT